MAVSGYLARGIAAVLMAAAPALAGDFLGAALVAGGSSGDVATWRTAYQDCCRQIVTDELLELPFAERVTALQQALHERILTGKYDTAASDLRVALSRGDFNCLSAAALLLDLSRQAEVELEIWWRPGHVWLQTPGGERLEAANPSLDLRASEPPSLARRVGVGRRITPDELLGKFYYNRGVQLLASGEYATGLALMRTALEYDPQDTDARENLLAGINNWAAEHLRAGRSREAARLIRQGLAIDPAYGPLVSNRRLLDAQAEQP
jgi:tetratricopeptide (TPR) repeat protein